MSYETLFSIGVSIATICGGILSAIKAKKWVKGVENKIPPPISDETKEAAEQALRDKINRELGVQLDARDKRIKALEESDTTKQNRISTLENDLKSKEREIHVLNQQVSRLEREHENEETDRKLAETRAIEAEKREVALLTRLEIYDATFKLMQEVVNRPTHVYVTIDGVLATSKEKEETANPNPT